MHQAPVEKVELAHISKKHFRPGGMALSEWTRSIWVVRDIPVADNSVPGANTLRRSAYRPLIAVSPCLLALSGSYCKRTLWRCGELWPYVGMGSWVHQQNGNRTGSHMQGSISTRHFVYHLRLCYSHKICYLIIWHALFKYRSIYSYGQSRHRW